MGKSVLTIVFKSGAVSRLDLPPQFCASACNTFGEFMRGGCGKHFQLDIQVGEEIITIATLSLEEVACMSWENEDTDANTGYREPGTKAGHPETGGVS